MSRRHDPTKARRHWIYSREEACALFGIRDGTITTWVRRGLEPVDNKRPQLFSGYELRRFLTHMRWPHGRSPESGRLFCYSCFGFKSMLAGTIQTIPHGIGCFKVSGQCRDCHSMPQASATATELSQIFGASVNIPGDSSDVIEGRASVGSKRNGLPIPPETSSSNQRWLYGYRIFLENHEEFDVTTVDDHLRAISRMSAHLNHKPFEVITIADAGDFKNQLRQLRDLEEGGLSRSTVSHTLDRCRAFYTWLTRRPNIEVDPDLPGYFSLSRKECAAESSMVKGTSLNFDQAVRMFSGMTGSNPVEERNRAIVAMFIVTGIRIGALITLRGKHVNTVTRWINQDPREVDTKLGTHIRTYCLDLGFGLLDAIAVWARWRGSNGFGDDEPFFLPDRYIQPNSIGLGFRPAGGEAARGWTSEDPVQRIIKDAASVSGITDGSISSHDFRKVLHPFLSKRGAMLIVEEVALQLNFGHTPVETIRKHYASMQDSEREEILDELCRRALSHRTELELYLGFERNMIAENDPDFRRAMDLFHRNSPMGA
jgi:site-specific recombinase XerC